MDLRAVMTISTLLLMTADQTPLPVSYETSFSTQTSSISGNISSSSTTPTTIAVPTSSRGSSTHPWGLLTISWIKCVGNVNLALSPSVSLPVCSNSNISSHLKVVCENQIGCKGTPSWGENIVTLNSYLISESGGASQTLCKTLRVQCTVENPECEDAQLQAYKVVTGLLCCVLLVLLLMRFTRPTIKALQKRLSDRRQNRWIGPTQSHSVSYHRGKTVVKNNDGEKRLSYPALERLAVSESREPSSNRNSDYNF